MIIELLLNAIYKVFQLLTTPINIPNLPSDVYTMFYNAFDYISFGIAILKNYTHFYYLISLVGIIMAIDIGISLYHFVMWVIKKIPFLGMS